MRKKTVLSINVLFKIGAAQLHGGIGLCFIRLLIANSLGCLRVENGKLKTLPYVRIEQVAIQRFAVAGIEPVVQWVREELLGW